MSLIVRISLPLSFPLMLYVLLSLCLGQCEMSIYPGLRRKPLSQAMQQHSYELSDTHFLSQLMEENARRRLQQQFEQQLELINMQLDRQRQREKDFHRREQERGRFKQIQLHRQKQQELMNRADWRELKEAGESMAAEDNVEYATTYTYNKFKNRNRPSANYETATANTMGSYNYKYPNIKFSKYNNLRERIPFAVPPSDPRFYEEDNNINNDNTAFEESNENQPVQDSVRVVNDNGSIESDEDIDLRTLDEYEEYVPAQSTTTPIKFNSENSQNSQNTDNAVKSAPSFPAGATTAPTQSSAATFHRIKPASAMAAAAVVAGIKPPAGSPNVLRHDINALIDKLQKEDGSIVKDHGIEPHLVVRHYLGMNDDNWGIYVVAIIAGLSAALTVGLLALGYSWMHNKTKAAADVEYPAYGVTGPNRDISPSGDRKLAQSAQMYHYQHQKAKIQQIFYQHQKQQIMAMDNRPTEGGLSDVESDDDIEEGDYTVYECPGLAPTGEMEVKNPLFLDETPVTTPSNKVNEAKPAVTAVNSKATHINLKHKKEPLQDAKKSSDSKKKENKK